MKFTIVGAGAIGGYLGARLSLAGHEVAFLARGRNLQAINKGGFRLIEEDGSEHHAPHVRAVAAVSDAGVADAVLLTVKAHQVVDLLPGLREGLGACRAWGAESESRPRRADFLPDSPPHSPAMGQEDGEKAAAAADLQPATPKSDRLLGPQTLLVTMVNGVPWWYFQRLDGPWQGRVVSSVDPGGQLAAAFDPGCLIGSVVYPAAELVEPGVVRVIEGNRFSLGELDGSRSARVEALSQALMSAGFKAPVSRDIRGELWVKLWGNLSFNPISALTHATLEDICRFAPTRELARRMMAEGQAVAEALGVRFRITLEQRLAGAQAVGAHKTSMLQDVEAGRGLELAALVGAVVELGQVAGVPTPTIEAVHAATALLAQTLSQGPTGPARLRPEPL